MWWGSYDRMYAQATHAFGRVHDTTETLSERIAVLEAQVKALVEERDGKLSG